MAMIQCPGCGGQISDRAKQCIHCGRILNEETNPVCPECGAEVYDGATTCNKCGCPIENHKPSSSEDEPQKVEVTKVHLNTRINKKAIVGIVIAILAIVIAIIGVKKFQEQKALEEAAQLSATYRENIETITYLMLSGAAESESAGNLTTQVWYNSIYEEYDGNTDKYTRHNNGEGTFYSDFNDALNNLFIDSDFQDTIDNIKSNQESVMSMMKQMKNPPEEWQDAYQDLQEYYDAYVQLTNLAISPTGSLQTFSTNFNNADAELINRYEKMKMHLN